MKRLTIKKLIVISQSESQSLEVPFEEGLNIILGENKTGKSSIIKSIFITFGCECKSVEKDWERLISAYLLFLSYGNEQYCIVRQGKIFQIFEIKNDEFICKINTDQFNEYSTCLMELLDVQMTCITKTNEQINVTPPLLFRFQYIDQDQGWNKIGESFNNVAYIKDWKKNSSYYVCGYLDDSYYELQTQKVLKFQEMNEMKEELKHNKDLISHIASVSPPKKYYESIDEVTKNIEKLLLNEEKLRKELVSYDTKMIILENKIYIDKQRLHLVQNNLKETEEDIKFAMKQDNELVCPVCGTTFQNEIENQLNITADYNHCEKLSQELEKNINDTEKELAKIKSEIESTNSEIQDIKQKISDSKIFLSYVNFYTNQGKFEILQLCEKQLGDLENKIHSNALEIQKIQDKIKEKQSRKRSNAIRRELTKYCEKMANAINLPSNYIKLKQFVQVLQHTGSECPREVYMYQSGLYLYNLSRMESPFNFLVVDTPNQQGQDEENLKKIFQSLHLLSSKNGQVIIGTERETGMEKSASCVTYLKEKRKCLTDENYKKHIDLFNKLQAISSAWNDTKLKKG